MESSWYSFAIYGLFLLWLSPHGGCSEHIAPLVGLDFKDRLPQEYIVLLKPRSLLLETRVASFRQYVSKHRILQGVDVLGEVKMGEFMALHVHAADDALELLRRNPEITSISTNNVVKVSSQETWTSEVDTGPCVQQDTGSELWGLARTSYGDKPNYNTAAYSYNARSGDDVTAYVIDTGIYTDNVDFEGRAVWGFTATNLTDEGDLDLHGHGTHVAGTIGGTRFGIAKNAKLVAVKIFSGSGEGNEFLTLEGIAWACNDFLTNKGRDKKSKAVINMSLGGPADSIIDNAVQVCTGWGMIFVMAAMNNFIDACDVSPARVSSAITVGATDINDTLASFSNWGPCVDILAPGVHILSAWIGSETSTLVESGTSMACPHVAGVVARYLSGLHEQPSPAQVKAEILDMAQKNKVNLGPITVGLWSTPNFLLHMPCAKVQEEQTDKGSSDVLVVTAITLSFVCLLLIAAILAGAFWGYKQWKQPKGGDPYVSRDQETSSTRNLPMP